MRIPGNTRDDHDILRRFRAGELAAFREVETWAKQVVRHFSLPESERDDIVQQTLTDLWHTITKPDFQLRENLRGLVRKIAAANCLDLLRLLRKWRRHGELDDAIARPDPRPGPHDRAERKNERLLLRLVLRALSPSCKEIIALHFFQELTYPEIGAQLGRAEGTMKVRMFNCIREIRKMLDQCKDPFIGRPAGVGSPHNLRPHVGKSPVNEAEAKR